MDTPVNGEAVIPLKSTTLTDLKVDAMNRSRTYCDSWAHIAAIELNSNARTATLAEIISRYEEIKEDFMRLKEQRSIPLPPGNRPPVTIGIQIFLARYTMIKELEKLDPRLLHEVVFGVQTRSHRPRKRQTT